MWSAILQKNVSYIAVSARSVYRVIRFKKQLLSYCNPHGRFARYPIESNKQLEHKRYRLRASLDRIDRRTQRHQSHEPQRCQTAVRVRSGHSAPKPSRRLSTAPQRRCCRHMNALAESPGAFGATISTKHPGLRKMICTGCGPWSTNGWPCIASTRTDPRRPSKNWSGIGTAFWSATVAYFFRSLIISLATASDEAGF